MKKKSEVSAESIRLFKQYKLSCRIPLPVKKKLTEKKKLLRSLQGPKEKIIYKLMEASESDSKKIYSVINK